MKPPEDGARWLLDKSVCSGGGGQPKGDLEKGREERRRNARVFAKGGQGKSDADGGSWMLSKLGWDQGSWGGGGGGAHKGRGHRAQIERNGVPLGEGGKSIETPVTRSEKSNERGISQER